METSDGIQPASHTDRVRELISTVQQLPMILSSHLHLRQNDGLTDEEWNRRLGLEMVRLNRAIIFVNALCAVDLPPSSVSHIQFKLSRLLRDTLDLIGRIFRFGPVTPDELKAGQKLLRRLNEAKNLVAALPGPQPSQGAAAQGPNDAAAALPLAKQNGQESPVQSDTPRVSKRGRGGRRPVPSSEAKRRTELVEAWHRAREHKIKLKRFALDKDVTPLQVTRAIDWLRKREARKSRTN